MHPVSLNTARAVPAKEKESRISCASTLRKQNVSKRQQGKLTGNFLWAPSFYFGHAEQIFLKKCGQYLSIAYMFFDNKSYSAHPEQGGSPFDLVGG